MANKIIISSLSIRNFLTDLLKYYPVDKSFDLVCMNKKLMVTEFAGLMAIETKSDFSVRLYKPSIKRFIKILRLLDEQPLTIELCDSERFGIIIKEAIV